METILSYLRHWREHQGCKPLFAFLDSQGREQESVTWQSFYERTCQLACAIKNQTGLQHGDRALLVYPPGLESITAFFACLRLGVIPVPVYAPQTNGPEAGFAKLNFVARDCQAAAALSTQKYWAEFPHSVALADVCRFATDNATEKGALWEVEQPHPVMFLQYTSGSTGDPKGVIVSHANVIHNCRSTLDHAPIGVCWLPQYHDMGLIGHYLFVVITGGKNTGFSPFDFLRRPALWFQALSRECATVTAAPNFAFEYCLRSDKLSDESLEGIDLSSIRMLLNAAEPVRAGTFRRFYERFAPYGLRREAFVAGYGLAESTVAVSMHGRHILRANKRRLQQRRLQIDKGAARNNSQTELVSCGRPLTGVHVRIVDPQNCTALSEQQIGEIWVAGPSKCAGYWQRPEINRQVFEARLADVSSDADTYLRTGDLGFLHDGELYVCGRVKDLIIIRGVNYYPQDIESIVEAALPPGRARGPVQVAAFSIDEEGEERLVVLVEMRNSDAIPDPLAIVDAIRTRYFIEPHVIDFVPPRTIARTTSGKVARGQTRDLWIEGKLPVLSRYVHDSLPGEMGECLRTKLERLRSIYHLDGREHLTIAEIGMDSLTMVDLVLEIQKYLEEHDAVSLADRVDASFLQDQTIGNLLSLARSFEESPDESAFHVKQRIRSLQKEHTAAEASRMHGDIRCSFDDLAAMPVVERPDCVLMTGSTGFFGPFLLASLLDRTALNIQVLIRANDEEHGRMRIAAALRRAGLWVGEREELLRDRVSVVCGDLSQERLGLAEGRWKELAARPQVILHNGAVVNYVQSYEAMRMQNVGGTHELLRLATSSVRKPFHFISSTFIFGWTTPPVLWETDHNVEMAGLDFGYSQSKWAAEELVRQAAAAGLPTRIYRPALISPALAGAGSRDDIAIRLLAFMIKYKLAVKADNQVSFVPAEVAADNIISILQGDRPTGVALHVTADDYYNFGDVTSIISERYGYHFDYLTTPEFIEAMNRLCTKDDPLYPLRLFLTRAQSKIEAMSKKRYDNREYRSVRQGLAEPSLAETCSAIVRFMLHAGLIPASPIAHCGNGQPALAEFAPTS